MDKDSGAYFSKKINVRYGLKIESELYFVYNQIQNPLRCQEIGTNKQLPHSSVCLSSILIFYPERKHWLCLYKRLNIFKWLCTPHNYYNCLKSQLQFSSVIYFIFVCQLDQFMVKPSLRNPLRLSMSIRNYFEEKVSLNSEWK